MPMKAKPGQLRSAHIEYDNEGDGATTTHMFEPEAGKKSDPWTPGPAPHKKSFSSRMEAHHHMAQMAGVNAEIAEANAARAHGKPDSTDSPQEPGGSEGDDDEDKMEDRGGPSQPGSQAQIAKQAPPARKV
jgi:hypothetical protein